jgi:hypothetical protein
MSRSITKRHDQSRSFTIVLDRKRPATGHSNHRSGSGVHSDSRTKRAKTRSAATRKAVKEFS